MLSFQTLKLLKKQSNYNSKMLMFNLCLDLYHFASKVGSLVPEGDVARVLL